MAETKINDTSVEPDALQRSYILLNVAQCAETLNVSTWTVRRLLKSGKLPGVRIGSRLLVKASDVASFVDQHTEIATDQPTPPGLAAGGDVR
jgi:excisionase family DNA binding protein